MKNERGHKIVRWAMEEAEGMKCRSAWERGVKVYALELLEELDDSVLGGYVGWEDLKSEKLIHKALLNGAADWHEYSWGGCSLIYDRDIAERLCTKTELKRTHDGELRPNKREEWLDTQARALYQAEIMVLWAFDYVFKPWLKKPLRRKKKSS